MKVSVQLPRCLSPVAAHDQPADAKPKLPQTSLKASASADWGGSTGSPPRWFSGKLSLPSSPRSAPSKYDRSLSGASVSDKDSFALAAVHNHADISESPTTLHTAATEGLTSELEAILRRGAYVDLREQGEHGYTALMLAAIGGHTAAVELLVDAGADVRAVDLMDGRTALHLGAVGNHRAVVQALLRAQADVCGSKDEAGMTALDLAALEGHMGIVHLLLFDDPLLEKGGRSVLHLAAERGCTTVLTAVLQSGEDVNRREQVGAGLTALMRAVQGGHLNAAKMLLDHGADAAAHQHQDQWQAMHMAVASGNIDMLLLLLTHGAPPNCVDKDGLSPLHIAARMGCAESAKLLLHYGASCTHKTKIGLSAIDAATSEGHLDVVSVLLSSQAANLNFDTAGSSPLHVAALLGEASVLTSLLQLGADVDLRQQNASGFTPLMCAAQQGQTAVVELLLGRQARADARDREFGATALHIAAEAGNVEVVEELLHHRAQWTDSWDKNGRTPLHLSAARGHCRVIQALLEHPGGTSPGQNMVSHSSARDSPVHWASNGGRQQRADVDQQEQGGEGCTPLMLAASSGHLAAVRLLLDVGASAAARSSQGGYTALHLASRHGQTEVMQLLLSRGAAVNCRSKATSNGLTPLMTAAESGELEAVKVVIQHGGDSNGATLQDSRTALDLARSAQHMEVANYLHQEMEDKQKAAWDDHSLQDMVWVLVRLGADLAQLPYHLTFHRSLLPAASRGMASRVGALVGGADSGTDVNKWDKRGSTALHLAAVQGHVGVLRVLLQAGADPDRRNQHGSGSPPLLLAASRGHWRAVRVLLQLGADVEAADLKTGHTPLHEAAGRGSVQIICLLIQWGADVNAQAEDGSTPLHHASRGGHTDCVQQLMRRGARVDRIDQGHRTAVDVADGLSKDLTKHLRLLSRA